MPRIRPLLVAALGVVSVSVATVVPADATPTPTPTPSPSPSDSATTGASPDLQTVAPRRPVTQQKYRGWVLTLKHNGVAAGKVRRQKATADAMAALDTTDATRVRSAASSHGAKVTRAQANAGDHMSVQLDKAIDTSSAASMVGGEVVAAEPDVVVGPTDAGSMTSTPNDTWFSVQWAITGSHGTRADKVWPSDTGKGVTVAVLDTGITDHPDLAGQTVAGYDFVSDATLARDGSGRDADPHDPGDWTTAGQCESGSSAEDSSWHGTHVASLVAAAGNNSTGITGVAPGAKVEPVRVLGACGGTLSDIADAITWASGGTVTGIAANPNPAKVINLSLGGDYPTCPTYYQTAIDGARSRGSVVVVAAGNSNEDASNSVPANCKGVITVAATGQSGTRASYSNYGSSVTLAAPGGGVTSNSDYVVGAINDGTTVPTTSDYGYMAGTSQATPQVAGIVALMAAVDPSLTPDQATSLLTSTATPTCDTSLGAGIANAPDAIAAAQALAAGTTPPSSSAATPCPTSFAATGLFGEHTGDSYADVYGVSSNGALTLFRGSSTSVSTVQSFGTSMAGVTYMAQIGDWTGDKRSDVLVRTSDNALWIYSSSATGALSPWRQVGQHWGGMDQIVYAGALDGQHSYVVAREASTGDLYRYLFTATGLSAKTKIGHGWGAIRTFFSVGDFNADGRSDVIGVRTDGTMWLYAGTTTAMFGGIKQVGSGWGTYPHAFSAGDLTGDGKFDLLGVDSSGNLYCYPNSGHASWLHATRVGTGFGAFPLLA